MATLLEISAGLDFGALTLVAVLGIALLFVRPVGRALRALSIFLIGYGAGLALYRVPGLDNASWVAALHYAGTALLTVATVGLILLGLTFPRPLFPARHRSVLLPLLTAGTYGVWRAALDIQTILRNDSQLTTWDAPGLRAVDAALYDVGFATFSAWMILLAIRCRRLARSGDEVAAVAAARVAIALVPICILIVVDEVANVATAAPADRLYWGIAALVLVPLLFLWPWATHGVGPKAARAARDVCIVIALFGLVWLVARAPGPSDLFDFVIPLARFSGLVFLAYAIARQQLFDIDIKVKWTLRRGTVAAIFLAVFFVVAQLAQNFLSDRYGWAFGGIAAGLLLFAIAPIQRAAERLSDRAMPSVRPEDPFYVGEKKRETYRNAYATAWADGTMTPKDVRLLHEVREALGLPEREIVAIEKEWAAGHPGKTSS